MTVPRRTSIFGRLAAPLLLAALALSGCSDVPPNTVVYFFPGSRGHFDPQAGRGGIGVMRNLLKTDRRPKAVIAGGDWFFGTPEGMIEKGAAAFELMDMAGFSAASAGMGDFFFGWKTLSAQAELAKTPLLCANLLEIRTGQRPEGFKQYGMVELNGVKIGLTAFVSRAAMVMLPQEKRQGIKSEKEVPAAQRAALALRRQGAAGIIAVLYNPQGCKSIPCELESSIIDAAPDIAALIVVDPERRESAAVRSHDSWIAYPRAGSDYAYAVEFTAGSGKKKISRMGFQEVSLNKNAFGEDSSIRSYLNELHGRVEKAMGKTLAQAAQPLPREPRENSPAGLWAADCLRQWGKTQIGIVNHSDIKQGIEAGPVSEKSLYSTFPDDDYVLYVSMRGTDLKKLFEQGLSGKVDWLHASGVTVEYDQNAAPGSRIRRMLVGDEPVLDDKKYRATVSDYLIMGLASEDDSGAVDFTEAISARRSVRSVLVWCASRSGVRLPAFTPYAQAR